MPLPSNPTPHPLPEPPSNQVVVLQVALQDVVLHRVEDKSNVVRVRGAGEVRVDDFFRVGIKADKHAQNEFGPGVGVPLGAWGEEGREGEAVWAAVDFRQSEKAQKRPLKGLYCALINASSHQSCL